MRSSSRQPAAGLVCHLARGDLAAVTRSTRLAADALDARASPGPPAGHPGQPAGHSLLRAAACLNHASSGVPGNEFVGAHVRIGTATTPGADPAVVQGRRAFGGGGGGGA